MLLMKNFGSSVLILQSEIRYLEGHEGSACLHVEEKSLVDGSDLALDRVGEVLEDAPVLHGHLVDLVGAELFQSGHVHGLDVLLCEQ